ncbi:MAG: oligosaccharide flippase family protein [Acidobacteriota bacterium]
MNPSQKTTPSFPWLGALFTDKGTFSLDFINTVVGKYASVAIGSVRTIMVPALLGPTTYGIWRLMMVAESLSRVAHLGTVSALPRQIPYYQGRHEKARESDSRSTALSTSFFGGLLTSFLILTGAALIRTPALRLPLLLFAVLNLVNRFVLFYRTLFGAERLFGSRAKIRLMNTALSSTLAVAAVAFLGLNGLIGATILISSLEIFLYTRRYPVPVVFRFNPGEFKESVRVGLPILLTGIIGLVLRNVDMLMITAMLGIKDVGLFGLGSGLSQKMSELAALIGFVAMPRLASQYGLHKKVAPLRNLVERPAIYVGLLFPLLALGAYFASEILLQTLWHSYGSGQNALRLLVLSTMFVAIYLSYSGFFATIRKQVRIIFLQGIIILLNVAGNYLLIRAGYGISGAALSTAVCLMVFSLVQTILALKEFAPLRQVPGRLLRIYVGPMVAIALALGEQAAVAAMGGSSLPVVLVAAVVALLAYTAMLLLVAPRFGIHLKQTILDLFRSRRVSSGAPPARPGTA